ncbi:MAG: hypothetical protein Q9216_005049 [Gyalolechia sp. 2 TL-2023]
MVKKKRTAAQFFDDAESNGHESLNKADIDGDTVSKHIESVHTNRATQEVQPFNDSANSALHDSEPFRYRD